MKMRNLHELSNYIFDSDIYDLITEIGEDDIDNLSIKQKWEQMKTLLKEIMESLPGPYSDDIDDLDEPWDEEYE